MNGAHPTTAPIASLAKRACGPACGWRWYRLLVLSGWPLTDVSLTQVASSSDWAPRHPIQAGLRCWGSSSRPSRPSWPVRSNSWSGVTQFPLLAMGLAPFVMGSVLMMTMPNQVLSALGRLNLIFMLVIFGPSNPQIYNPEVFLDVSLFVGLAAALLLMAQALIPPLVGRAPSIVLLGSARRELERLPSRGPRATARKRRCFVTPCASDRLRGGCPHCAGLCHSAGSPCAVRPSGRDLIVRGEPRPIGWRPFGQPRRIKHAKRLPRVMCRRSGGSVGVARYGGQGCTPCREQAMGPDDTCFFRSPVVGASCWRPSSHTPLRRWRCSSPSTDPASHRLFQAVQPSADCRTQPLRDDPGPDHRVCLGYCDGCLQPETHAASEADSADCRTPPDWPGDSSRSHNARRPPGEGAPCSGCCRGFGGWRPWAPCPSRS